ncbi:MAG: HPF/RaiA family ribosome-associated protein [Planctomycetes bacterium]|nr:HPF/RaiA family ribosome-associated protein [Planctomycetota bacterium]
MLIQVHFDGTPTSDTIETYAIEQVEKHLAHVADRLTRVEVHLKDENSHKSGAQDKSCTMEARPKGRQPIAVDHKCDNFQQVISETAGKLERALKRAFERAQ